jgi:tetratricopeptide (TPR) repeat protein
MKDQMEQRSPANRQGTNKRLWFRVLRPLFWWLLLLLVLGVLRAHEQLSKSTSIKYIVSLDGTEIWSNGMVTFDGRTLESGERVPVGNHNLVVSHPKAESLSTNLFIWYGENDLGTLPLARIKGNLIVEADSPAPVLTIRGAEFSQAFNNCSKESVPVPVGSYVVEAKYSYWNKREEVNVTKGGSTKVRFEPRLGALEVKGSHPDTFFKLFDPEKQELTSGKLPLSLNQLPEGVYTISTQHGRHKHEQIASVEANKTNNLRIEYSFGAAAFQTEPAGAVVRSENSGDLGTTPLFLAEVALGPSTFTLKREGYEPVVVSLEISERQTNFFRTNLVSSTYLGAIKAAKSYLNSENFQAAIEAAEEALRIQPGDKIASSLTQEATRKEYLRTARVFATHDDYDSAKKQLRLALELQSTDEQITELLAQYTKKQEDLVDRKQKAILNRGRDAFSACLKKHPDADLFETYELKSNKKAAEVEAAIAAAIQGASFEIKRFDSTDNRVMPGTFTIEAIQELKTALATSAGRRECLIVGAQIKADETQILFKVLEYKAEAINKLSIGNLINTPVNVKYVPIHPQRISPLPEKLQAQVKDGATDVQNRIRNAIGAP